MAINKITLNGETILDLSKVNISSEDVLEEKIFVDVNGEQQTGILHQYLPEYQTLTQGIDADGCLTIPAGPEVIGDYLFYNNLKIEKIKFVGDFTKNNHTIKTIGKEAFKNTKITELVLPETVIDIKDSAFEGCPINNLVLPKSLKTIGESAFAGSRINNSDIFYFPDNLESIGSWAFNSSSIGPKIRFPISLKTIYSYAFLQCTSIEEIFVGNPIEQEINGVTQTILLSLGIMGDTEGISENGTIFLSNISYSEACKNENGENVTVVVTNNEGQLVEQNLIRQLRMVFIPLNEKLNLYPNYLTSSTLPTSFTVEIGGKQYTKTDFKYYDLNLNGYIHCYGSEMSEGNGDIKPWYPNSVKELGIFVDSSGDQYLYVAALWPTQGVRDQVYADFGFIPDVVYYDGEKNLIIQDDAFWACSELHTVTLQGVKEFHNAFYSSKSMDVYLRDLTPPDQENLPALYDTINLYIPKDSLELYKTKWPSMADRFLVF